jgi:hypothetical protein
MVVIGGCISKQQKIAALLCALSPSAHEEEYGEKKRKRRRAGWTKLLGCTRLNRAGLRGEGES